MTDKLILDGIEYTVEWDGEHVTLRSEDSASVGHSNAELIVGEADGDVHVEFGDETSAWIFESLTEAERFRLFVQDVLNRHLAAAREAGRREALAKGVGRCEAVDNQGYRCVRGAGHGGWHSRDGKPPPAMPLPRPGPGRRRDP